MPSPLSYLLIIQKSGLPVYAQSFSFDDDEACRTFNNLLKPSSETANAHLMGSYFTSMQLFADEMVADKLNLIELGFDRFEIKGLIREEVFFVAIVQHFPDTTKGSVEDFLSTIADRFLSEYSLEIIHSDMVDHLHFSGFTDILIKLTSGISPVSCRNCLTKCTTENKGCLPHSFYFEKVRLADDLIVLN